MKSSNNNIFFYSGRCKESIKLKELLEREGIFSKFTFVSIDNLKTIPPGIKMTPTLIVQSSSVPLDGLNAFQWLERFKQLRLNYQMNNLVKKSDNEPMEFAEKEMAGFSDLFSYVNKEDAQPQMFSGVKEDIKIFTPPDIKKQKMSVVMQKKNYDELLKKRNEQDKALVQINIKK